MDAYNPQERPKIKKYKIPRLNLELVLLTNSQSGHGAQENEVVGVKQQGHGSKALCRTRPCCRTEEPARPALPAPAGSTAMVWALPLPNPHAIPSLGFHIAQKTHQPLPRPCWAQTVSSECRQGEMSSSHDNRTGQNRQKFSPQT